MGKATWCVGVSGEMGYNLTNESDIGTGTIIGKLVRPNASKQYWHPPFVDCFSWEARVSLRRVNGL